MWIAPTTAWGNRLGKWKPLFPVQTLSPLSSDRPRLHLPKPEFDSTHQVLRVPVPRLDMGQLARSETPLPPCGMPSMAIAAPREDQALPADTDAWPSAGDIDGAQVVGSLDVPPA